MTNIDIELMTLALDEARRGLTEGEVPVGAVVVVDGCVVTSAHNRPIGLDDPTAHAEMIALRQAGKETGAYRLTGAALYVTLEPCVMCIGAMINARIARLYFGARDRKAGAVGSVYDIGRDGRLNHRIEVYPGLLEEQCSEILKKFFRERRTRK